MDEYVKKEEIQHHIEQLVCRHCDKYNHGEFCKACGICKVSVCFQCIALATVYNFNPKDEIGRGDVNE